MHYCMKALRRDCFIWFIIIFVVLYIIFYRLFYIPILPSDEERNFMKSITLNSLESRHLHSEISEYIKNRITEFARGLMISKGVPGMTISIVKDDKVWVLPLGYRDLDDESPVTDDTKFLIGSITKTFTAQLTAVMIEESKRKLSWDTRLKEILGSTLTMASDRLSEIITLRDILSHRSGLVSGNLAIRASLPYNTSRKDFLKLLRHIPVNQNQASHEKFLYSNMGYTLAGVLLEHWWNESWEHLMEQKLFTPLGLTSTSLARTAEDLISKKSAKPYVPTEGGIKASDPSIYELGPMAVSGSILSSAKDMAKWMQFVLRREKTDNRYEHIISSHLMDTMWIPNCNLNKQFKSRAEKTKIQGWPIDDVSLGYGLGWFINKYNGMINYWHGGGIYSYYSLVKIFPEINLGLFISINGYKGCSELKNVDTHLCDCSCGSNGFSIVEPMAYFISDILNNDKMWLNLTNQCTYPQPWINCNGQQQNENKKSHIKTKNSLKNGIVTEELTPLKFDRNSIKIFEGTYTNSLLGESLVTLSKTSPYLYFKIRRLTGFLHPQLDKSDLSFWLECDQYYRFLSKPDNLSYIPTKKTFTFKFNINNQWIESMNIYFSEDEAPFLFIKK